MPKLDEAHRITLGRITPLGVERVDLQSVLGRVLAMAATASWDMPHYDNPARDGFALRSADCAAGGPFFGSPDAEDELSSGRIGG